MIIKYNKSAGYYGTGGWQVVSTRGCFGDVVVKVFATMQEAKDYINKLS